MARILVDSTGVDIEHAMAFLRDQNMHMGAKLGGEPSDDDTADESGAAEQSGETEDSLLVSSA